MSHVFRHGAWHGAWHPLNQYSKKLFLIKISQFFSFFSQAPRTLDAIYMYIGVMFAFRKSRL